jgi:DNA invertase Pin-like site-specific DNA recombinase
MIFGYCRVSTVEQLAGFEAQKAELLAAGAEKLFCEQVSSVAQRAKLTEALDQLRPGDTLLVTKLDRLARSMRDLLSIVATVEGKGASLRILAMDFSTGTATGKLILNVIGSIAEWERSMMLERQKAGIEKAKAEGRYKGRKPTAKAKRGDVLALKAQGIGPAAIARTLGIGRASVYRIIDDAKAN